MQNMVVSSQVKSIAGHDQISDRLQKSEALCQIVPEVPQPETIDFHFPIYLCKNESKSDYISGTGFQKFSVII